MPDKPLEQACDARVCIHTDQILDSCMDKDCVEDLRVYLTRDCLLYTSDAADE